MVEFRSLHDPEKKFWSGSELVGILSEKSQLFLFAHSPKTKSLISWSCNSMQVLGLSDADIAKGGNLFLRHVHPDDRFLLMKDLEKAMEGKGEYRSTYRWIKPNTNEVRWLHCRAHLVKSADQQLFEGFIVDLSDEVTGTISSFAGPDSINAVLAALSKMVIILDVDLRILRINRFKDGKVFLFGDDNFSQEQFRLGRPFLNCFSDQEQSKQLERQMRRVIKGLTPYYRTRIHQEDLVFALEISPLTEKKSIKGILTTVSDITEVVRLERQLADLQKTEGLRLIAAGVSHNFNNCLQAIIGHASVINSHPDKTNLVKEASQSIIDVVKRTSGLAKHLHNPEDSPVDSLASIDLNLAVMAAVNRIDDLFSRGTKVAVTFGNPSPVLAKQDQVIDVVAAVLQNAKDSLSQGGHITIKTYETILQDFEVEDLKAGKYTKLVVSDNGPGMSADTRSRCLDPFFTTKNKDPQTGVGLKGEGLGLSAAFSVVRKFGGAISIDSSPGFGTTVSIYLPTKSAIKKTEVPDKTDSVKKYPSILVVDDDQMVLETLRLILQDLGYQAVLTDNGRKAIELLRQNRSTINLALLDAVMPGLNGPALLKRLKKIKDDLIVIGFSGASPEITKAMLKAGAVEILRKPLGAKDLKKALERFLKTRQAA